MGWGEERERKAEWEGKGSMHSSGAPELEVTYY
jgi:hypothetical protein